MAKSKKTAKATKRAGTEAEGILTTADVPSISKLGRTPTRTAPALSKSYHSALQGNDRRAALVKYKHQIEGHLDAPIHDVLVRADAFPKRYDLHERAAWSFDRIHHAGTEDNLMFRATVDAVAKAAAGAGKNSAMAKDPVIKEIIDDRKRIRGEEKAKKTRTKNKKAAKKGA